MSLSLFAQSIHYQEAYRIYKAGEFVQALKMFEVLVEKEKDYDAAYILGFMYENGEGCKIDLTKSQKYYKISSRGYYLQLKEDPTRDSTKEASKLYNSLEKNTDKETQKTLKQYTQSLYNIKAYSANYFLPLSYRVNGTYPQTNGHEGLNTETEFQVSLKYDYGVNLFGLSETYSVAYTQLSFWQLYADSAYFRETNYNPEAFVTFPFSRVDYLKALRISFAHQSNGRGGEYERSWNYLSGKVVLQTGYIFTTIKLWYDLFSLKYNPNLMEYLGYGELEFVLPYAKHILKLKSRNTFSKYRATELNYSYPLFGSDDLFFYFKAFSGYGESLIDYDNKIDKIGIGFSISR